MKTTLTAKIENHFVITLDITQEEAMNLSQKDMEALYADIREVTGVEKILEEERRRAAEELQKEREMAPFVCTYYKGVKLENPRGDRAHVEEMLLDEIIAASDIYLPSSVQDEIEYTFTGTLQGMKYQKMFESGSPLKLTEEEAMAIKKEVEQEVAREYKVEQILKSIIAQEKLTCTMEEKEAAAQEICIKDNCDMELVKKFMGEDFGLLERDVLLKKAKAFIYDNAILG